MCYKYYYLAHHLTLEHAHKVVILKLWKYGNEPLGIIDLCF